MTIYIDADAVDIALINLCRRGNIVITQDYGVAALALGLLRIPRCFFGIGSFCITHSMYSTFCDVC